MRKAKLNYKIKLEKEFSMNNLGSVWKGMTLISGTKGYEIKKVQLPELAEELNKFYLHFDVPDFGPAIESMKSKTSYGCASNFFDELYVMKVLRGSNVRKSPGPDKIGGHLIKVCAEQLAPVFCNIFRRSIALQRVPKLCKEAIVVPVPKTTHAVTLNDLRPIALTSLIMKCFEKLVKDELLDKTKDL